MADATPKTTHPNVVDWRQFLTDFPPGSRASVEGVVETETTGRPRIVVPELQLHCDNCFTIRYCAGTVRGTGQFFPGLDPQRARDFILWYICQKCQTQVKSFAIRVLGDVSAPSYGTADTAKMGEWPAFSFVTPARLITLIGPDRDLFLQGRKAECQGLGIGAFSYYRRIIESQKDRLLSEVLRVARHTNAPANTIEKLERAIGETQFHKAMDMVKDAVPASLLLKGQNPFTLLHGALSRNLHAASDEECLNLARDIRIVLFELAENLGQALKDEAELSGAVSRLLNRSK